MTNSAIAQDAQQAYEDAVSEGRYRVVRNGFWWCIEIGEGTARYGRFYSKASAERMTQLLRREFLNGAFVVRHRDAELRKLGSLIVEGHRGKYPLPHA